MKRYVVYVLFSMVLFNSWGYAAKFIEPGDESDLGSSSVDIVRAYDAIWTSKKKNNTTVLVDIAYNYLSLDYAYTINTDDGRRSTNVIYFDGGILYSGNNWGLVTLNSLVLLDTETDKTNWALGENLIGVYYRLEDIRFDLAQIGEIKPYTGEKSDGSQYFHKNKGSLLAMEYYSEYSWFDAWLFNTVIYDYSALVIFDTDKVRSVRIKGGGGDGDEKLEYTPVINYLHFERTYQAGINYKNYMLDDQLFFESELVIQYADRKTKFALGHFYGSVLYYPFEPKRHNIKRDSKSCIDRGCSCLFSSMFYPYLKAGYSFMNEMIYSNIHGIVVGAGVESYFFDFSFDFIYNYYNSLVQLSVVDESIYRFKLTGYF